MKKTNYDFSKLKGRIIEKNFTMEEIAKAIKISKTSFSYKINNIRDFNLREVDALIKQLDIPAEEIENYFFKQSVE